MAKPPSLTLMSQSFHNTPCSRVRKLKYVGCLIHALAIAVHLHGALIDIFVQYVGVITAKQDANTVNPWVNCHPSAHHHQNGLTKAEEGDTEGEKPKTVM